MKTKDKAHFPITKLLVTKHESDIGEVIYVAESVEYCLATQAKSLEKLWQSFGHVFFGTILVSFENNEPVRFGEPFEDVMNTWAKLSEKNLDPDMKVRWYEFYPDWISNAMGKLSLMFGASRDMEEVEVRFRHGSAQR